mmetsp:Transcript_36136/g.115702  ORF Transcript_36136/g.115702 Transcript_36136/m.115702 type:complete len:359 (+) Transcript_36136:196-1272(+)
MTTAAAQPPPPQSPYMSGFDILAACTCSIVYVDPEPNAPSDFYRTTELVGADDYENQETPDSPKAARRPTTTTPPRRLLGGRATKPLKKKVSWADERKLPLEMKHTPIVPSLSNEPETERHVPQRSEPLEVATVELFAAATRLASLPLGIVLIRLRALCAPAKAHVFAPDAVALRIEAATFAPFRYDETFVFANVDHNVFVAFLLELCASSGITNQALLRAATATLEKLSFEQVADLVGPFAKQRKTKAHTTNANAAAKNKDSIVAALIDAAGLHGDANNNNGAAATNHHHRLGSFKYRHHHSNNNNHHHHSSGGGKHATKLNATVRLLDAVQDDDDRRAIVQKTLLAALRSDNGTLP